jgi:hypothetical protein
MRDTAASLNAMGASEAKYWAARKEPSRTPTTNTRFHDSAFQSYFKKSKLLGTQAAHMCLNEELMPNVLFSKMRCSGTIKPMMGPATYQGHGWLTHSTSEFMSSKVLDAGQFPWRPGSHKAGSSRQCAAVFAPPKNTGLCHQGIAPFGREAKHEAPRSGRVRRERLDATVTHVHPAQFIDHHNAFQRQGEAVLGELSPGLFALQRQARHVGGVPMNPAHGALAQPARAIEKKKRLVHAPKFVQAEPIFPS